MDLRKVKIRTPKWQVITSAAWAKELLMTFIGATLSIVLTFGTAHFVDQKQQREDARQMAMMVIHDMENTAQQFKDFAKSEERYYNSAQYLLEHLDQPDSLTIDSIYLFVAYVTAGNGDAYTYDDSGEQIFVSSQEAWKTINNPAFIDNVQNFFHLRKQMYRTFNVDPYYRKPVPLQAYYDMATEFVGAPGDMKQNLIDELKAHWLTPEVKAYLKNHATRKIYFNRYADQIISVSSRCKFMMGISDEELAQFVANRTRIGTPVKPHQLIGRWQVVSADDIAIERDFRKDHSYTYFMTQYMPYSYYTGDMEINYKFMGTWNLKGDSLIILIDSCTHEFDKSHIRYQPEMESAIESLIQMWEPEVVEYEQTIVERDEKSHQGVFVSIDKTGNKIEMRINDDVQYMIRSDKP